MCGIAGAIGSFSRGAADQIVRSMTAALTHRGPDDSGSCCCVLGPHVVALGNTRLSILDLSAAGHQPMSEQSGCYSTVFNGEIYNFKELRKLLDPENCLFRTSSDTEVILHAYHRWSEKAFQRFRGMFAFALFDKKARKIYLVRDPLGIKPLYFYVSGERLIFASEVKALLASGEIERRIETEAVAHFLSYGWVGASNTAIAGIKLLQPGQMLSVDLSHETIDCKLSAYAASIPVAARASDTDRNEASAHMFHLLAQSVKCHLTSDVPVGLFLSGGIDSTVLLHLMREAGCTCPKTFTVVFAGKRFNESQPAKEMARRYDTEHHDVEVCESSLLAQLPSALAAMDQPTMDGINTFVIAKAVRSAGVKVALSGLGGDELFAGYPSFRRARWASRVAKVPPRVRAAIAASCRRVKLSHRQEKAWDLLESDCSPLAAYRISRRLFGSQEINALAPGTPVFDHLAPFPSSGDEINDISRLELTGYMTGLLLRDTDFMSMANSLEVRVPFIDRVVVDHALRLPGHWKLAPSVSKVLLLDAMKGALPGYIWKRPKMGFVVPFELWMRTSLRTSIEETFGNRRLAAALGFSTQGLEELWRGFVKGRIRWSKPWSLFVLLRWCELQCASI